MLNLTLRSLSIKSTTFLSPHISSRVDLKLYDTRVFRSCSTFVYNSNTLLAKNVHFNNFLDSVIKKRSECREIYGIHKHQLVAERYCISLLVATFTNCVAIQEGGGAVLVHAPSQPMYIDIATFSNCSATINDAMCGGAINFIGDNAVFTKCRFSGCYAQWYGQSIYVKTNSTELLSSFNYSLVTRCAPLQSYGGYYSIYYQYGNGIIYNLNSSKNRVCDYGAAIGLECFRPLIQQSIFERNNGRNIFYANLGNGQISDLVLSLINCTAPAGNLLMWTSTIQFSECNFLSNRFREFAILDWNYIGEAYFTRCHFNFQITNTGITHYIDCIVIPNSTANSYLLSDITRKTTK